MVVANHNSLHSAAGEDGAKTGEAEKIVHDQSQQRRKRLRNTVILVSAILIIGLTLAAIIPPSAIGGNQTGAAQQANSLQPATNSAGGVSFEVTPQGFSPNEQVVFQVSINTHQGSLDYDFAKVSTLETSSGGNYTALKWDGATGGHHLSGTLTFPSVGQTNLLRLTIRGVYGVPERVFEWNLASVTGGSSGSKSTSSISLASLNLLILGGAIVAALLAAFLMNTRQTTTKEDSANKENYDKSTEREESER